MNSFNKLSLKVVISIAFFVLFVLLQGGVFFIEYQQEQKKLSIDKEQFIKGVTGHLQTALSHTLMRLDNAYAQQIVSLTALDPDFRSIAIIDHSQKILLSNKLRQKATSAELTLPEYKKRFHEKALENNELLFIHNRQKQELIIYAPLQMLPESHSLSREFNGLIYLRYSLNNAIASLRYQALISLIEISITLLVVILLLYYFIHYIVIRPINRLAEAATVSNLGRKLDLDLTGVGEIGVLQKSLAQLASDVSQNFNTLSANEQRWLYALSASRDGVWDWDIENDQVYYSAHWKTMLGCTSDDIGDDILEWESRIHNDDLCTVVHDLKNHFLGKTSYFENTHRMRGHDGQYRWMLMRGQTISWDDTGQPLRIIGTHTDISAYKLTS